MTRRDTGFSIVEMLVVIGVVATLALMTLPSYLEKGVRDQVIEALPLADIAKPPLAAAWTLGRRNPLEIQEVAGAGGEAGAPPYEGCACHGDGARQRHALQHRARQVHMKRGRRKGFNVFPS